MRLNSLEEVKRWALGFGRHATVVEPEELKRRLSETAGELHRQYGEEPAVTGTGVAIMGKPAFRL